MAGFTNVVMRGVSGLAVAVALCATGSVGSRLRAARNATNASVSGLSDVTHEMLASVTGLNDDPYYEYRLGWRKPDEPVESLTQAEQDWYKANKPGFKGYKYRATYAKQTRCSSTSCEECSSVDGSDCFAAKPAGQRGIVVTSMTGNYNRFESHIHISCPAETMYMSIFVTKLLNGALNYYWNGQKFTDNNDKPAGIQAVAMFDKSDKTKYPEFSSYSNWIEYGITFDLTVQPKGNVLIVEFVPNQVGASFELYDLGIEVAAAHAQCMDHKTCIKVLEATGEKGLALRNDNGLQRNCLEPKLKGTGSLKYVGNRMMAWSGPKLYLNPKALETGLASANDFWVGVNSLVTVSSTKSSWTITEKEPAGSANYQISAYLTLQDGTTMAQFGSDMAYLAAFFHSTQPSLTYHPNGFAYWAQVPQRSAGGFALQMVGGATDQMKDSWYLAVGVCASTQGPCPLTMVSDINQAAVFAFDSDLVTENSACRKWTDCMETAGGGQVSRVVEMLDAAGTTAAVEPLAFSQIGSNVTGGSRDGGGACMDPTIEDPQSWDCDCWEDMNKRCVAIKTTPGYALAACLRANFCLYPQVCESWKTANCATAPVPALKTALEATAAASLLQDEQSQAKLLNRASREVKRNRASTQALEQTVNTKGSCS